MGWRVKKNGMKSLKTWIKVWNRASSWDNMMALKMFHKLQGYLNRTGEEKSYDRRPVMITRYFEQ